MSTERTADAETIIRWGRETLQAESSALAGVAGRLGSRFADAARALVQCRGRVPTTGVGKAGLVARKVAATLSSVGTPAFWLHPCDAVHGDLGVVCKNDVVMAFSKSGEADELVRLIGPLRDTGATLVGVTCSPESSLGRRSDVLLDLGPVAEAGPLGLAPSTSTTAMMAVGDALAFAVMRLRGVARPDYARCHPGGDLGRRLLRVEEIMRRGAEAPTVDPAVSVREMLLQRKRAAGTHRAPGAAAVVDASGRLIGIFTDGDLRRHLEEGGDFLDRPLRDVMTPSPRSARVGMLAIEVAELMRQREIDEMPIVDDDGKLAGVLDVQDLLAAGLIVPGGPEDDD
jgi:arabinose-5-phosphate isomerase